MPTHLSQSLRHPLRMRELTVLHSERLSPHMQRVVLGGEALQDFVSAAPDDHVKLFFPNRSGALVLPTLGPDGPVYPAAQEPSPARDYTPRHYDAARQQLTVDFVLHGEGPAASWAAQASPGQRLGVGGPRGSLVIADDFDTYVLIGDETALPAIGRWLEELPPNAHAEVLLEIPDAADRQPLHSRATLNLQWLERHGVAAADSRLLEDALQALPIPAGDAFYWIAIESRRARNMRIQLSQQRQIPKDWLKATGYWKADGSDEA